MTSHLLTSTSFAQRHPALADFLAHPWNVGAPPGDEREPLLHRYVAQGGRLVNAAARHDLAASVELLRAKCRALRLDDREAEAGRVAFLTRFLASARSAGPRSAPLRRAASESAFALLYLVAESDLVPDHVPDIGLADDAAVLTAVLERNERVLRDFARQLGLEWAALLPPLPAARAAEARAAA